MDKKIIIGLSLIFLIAILIRLPSLNYQGFINPQGYMFYSIIIQTINNNYVIPSPLVSPINQQYYESPLLVYFPIILWLLFAKTITLLTIMNLLIPSILIVLGILVVYALTEKIFGNYKIALISAFIYSTSGSSIYHLSFLEYIGDNFSPILGAISIYFLISVLEDLQKGKISIMKIILAFLSLILGISFWNGGMYLIGLIPISLFLHFVNKLVGLKLTILIGLLSIVFGVYLLQTYYTLFMQPSQVFSWQFTLNSLGLILPFGIFGIIIFGLGKNSKKNNGYLILLGLFILSSALYFQLFRWISLLSIPLCIFAGYGAYSLTKIIPLKKFVSYLFIANLLILNIAFTYLFAYQQFLKPLDYTTHSTFQVLNWIQNNTPMNSVILSDWDGGALIGLIPNRFVYLDSFSSDSKIFMYGNFILGENLTYLEKMKSNYYYVRYASRQLFIETKISNLSNNVIFQKTLLYKMLYQCQSKCIIENVTFNNLYSNNDGIVYSLNYTR